MKTKARIIIVVAPYQEEGYITAVAHPYLQGIASLFYLELFPFVHELSVDEGANSDLVGHKFLVYEFHSDKPPSCVLPLLAGVVQYLQGLGVFFVVVFDKFPYKTDFKKL